MTTRRQLLKAAAWAIPAITVAVATPAIAASDTCPDETYFHPASATDPWDGVQITVRTGHFVEARFIQGYPYAAALNIGGQIIDKVDSAPAGTVFLADLAQLGICDPTFIQVDGTNTHYYGNGVFK